MAQLRFQLNIRGICVNWPLFFLSIWMLNLHHHLLPFSSATIPSITATPSYQNLAPPNRLPYPPSHSSITITGEKIMARTNARLKTDWLKRANAITWRCQIRVAFFCVQLSLLNPKLEGKKMKKTNEVRKSCLAAIGIKKTKDTKDPSILRIIQNLFSFHSAFFSFSYFELSQYHIDRRHISAFSQIMNRPPPQSSKQQRGALYCCSSLQVLASF